MGTNCAPCLVIFSFSLWGRICPIITEAKIFILTFMHIIDVVSVNNPNFANWIPLQNNEDTKGVIRSRKSKKDIQYND